MPGFLMPIKNMKPSEIAKKEGLKGLKELSEISEKPEQTLIGWAKRSPVLFYILVLGAVEIKRRNEQQQETEKGASNGTEI